MDSVMGRVTLNHLSVLQNEGNGCKQAGTPVRRQPRRMPAITSHVSWDFSISSILQFSSVAQSCPTLCDPMNPSMPDLSIHHQLPEFTQTHVHRVRDAIQPSHPRSSPSPPNPNPSQHQSLFQWVNCLHEVARVLEFQPQHQSFQWTSWTGLL